MKSIFVSLLVIIALATQVSFVAAHGSFSSINGANDTLSAEEAPKTIAEPHMVVVDCHNEGIDNAAPSSCAVDSKFFPVSITHDFPQKLTAHTVVNDFRLEERPTAHHLRPPIS